MLTIVFILTKFFGVLVLSWWWVLFAAFIDLAIYGWVSELIEDAYLNGIAEGSAETQDDD